MSTEKRARLTPREWAEAAGLWQSGEVTLDQLEERYGVSKEHFSRKFKEMGVKKGEHAAEHAQQVQEAVAKGALADAALIAQRVRRTKEDHYEWSAALGRMIMHEVVTARQNGTPLAVIDPTLKSIKRALEGLKIAREERYSALGLDKGEFIEEDRLPELMVAEMTASDIENARRRQMDDALAIGLRNKEEELDEGADENGVVVEGED